MFDIELVFLAMLGKVIGQEYVRLLRQLIEHFLPPGCGKIDADAALAAVGMLDQRVPQGIELDPAHVEETALGIAAHRMLDLDHVGPPVGEDRAGGGSEGELRDFQNAHALHDFGRHCENFLSNCAPLPMLGVRLIADSVLR